MCISTGVMILLKCSTKIGANITFGCLEIVKKTFFMRHGVSWYIYQSSGIHIIVTLKREKNKKLQKIQK